MKANQLSFCPEPPFEEATENAVCDIKLDELQPSAVLENMEKLEG
eukprot:CAMPEP_0117748850 /NCGR_PEP_ID=MMETSP0947-20121206/9395_1 /TAXON_ID=44440 /ORGANISM="Chattonella subsalsa, Strain CCMP2191" /LENGTH=44 /DNA_ID= /DNA_START= /DNA_END= /DNA_ORIENTATION=